MKWDSCIGVISFKLAGSSSYFSPLNGMLAGNSIAVYVVSVSLGVFGLLHILNLMHCLAG